MSSWARMSASHSEPASSIVTHDDAALSTESQEILPSATRGRLVIIQNLDSTDKIRFGDALVSSSRGLRLGPGETGSIYTTSAVKAVAEANTPSVSVTEMTYS